MAYTYSKFPTGEDQDFFKLIFCLPYKLRHKSKGVYGFTPEQSKLSHKNYIDLPVSQSENVSHHGHNSQRSRVVSPPIKPDLSWRKNTNTLLNML